MDFRCTFFSLVIGNRDWFCKKVVVFPRFSTCQGGLVQHLQHVQHSRTLLGRQNRNNPSKASKDEPVRQMSQWTIVNNWGEILKLALTT